MNQYRTSVIATLLTLLSLVLASTADGRNSQHKDEGIESERLFVTELLPLIKSRCVVCHGAVPSALQGGLDLSFRDTMIRGGDSGKPAVVPGDSEGSLLYQAVRWQGLEMPPKENDRLAPEQIEWIRRWIDAGAPWPDEQRQASLMAQQWPGKGDTDGIQVQTSGGLAEEWTVRRYKQADLWAYRSVRKPEVPWTPSSSAETPLHANPIDAFVDRKLEEHGLRAAPIADRHTLIRRVTYDLTGLAPTPQEIDQFVADQSDGSYKKTIDRLLESPRYGEQWARYWLDVTRYADTSGFSRDDARPNAWRYRDYVIRAFIDDKPFDRFILEQIAGDELDPSDAEMLIAAGFLRMGPWEHTGMAVEAVTRQQYLDDATNAVGETFLGQILRCAKCHDHKFDPIPTRDYYQLMATLAPVQPAERPARFLPMENTVGFEEHRKRLEQLKEKTRRQMETIARKKRLAEIQWLSERGTQTNEEDLVKTIKELPKEKRPPRHLGMSLEDLGVFKVMGKRIEFLNRQLVTYEPYAFSVYNGPYRVYKSPRAMIPPPKDLTGEIQVIHILTGGSVESPSERVIPATLSAAAYDDAAFRSSGWGNIPNGANGRRLALARWIGSPENPFTARVIVNRIWQHHFSGKGIVATPNNFGVTGQRPTHPELLDFLAAWFVENDWSIKKLHRLILTSNTYRRSGRHPDIEEIRESDPNNEWLAYYPARRLSAEEIRDSMLALSGELDLTMGGPGVYPEINPEVALQPILVMGSVSPAWQPSPLPQQRHRRTIYTHRQRNRGFPFLEAFNRPTSDTSCERRDQTTVTTQALTLLNSQHSRDRALATAARVQNLSDDPKEQIQQLFRLALGRSPTHDQLDQCLNHLNNMTTHHQQLQPVPVEPARQVLREAVEEMTGESFSWVEHLDVHDSGRFVPDLKPWNVTAETRALAEVCLVIMNSNEFLYVY